MTPYDLLRDKCNELLPERLELKPGNKCILDYYDGCGYDDSSEAVFLCRDRSDEYIFYRLTTEYEFDTINVHDITKEHVQLGWSLSKILGPELTITDVLRALHRAYPLHDYYVTASGTLHKQRSKMLADFFLSAPLSDPSNAAACEAVLKLLDSENVWVATRVLVCLRSRLV